MDKSLKILLVILAVVSICFLIVFCSIVLNVETDLSGSEDMEYRFEIHEDTVKDYRFFEEEHLENSEEYSFLMEVPAYTREMIVNYMKSCDVVLKVGNQIIPGANYSGYVWKKLNFED